MVVDISKLPVYQFNYLTLDVALKSGRYLEKHSLILNNVRICVFTSKYKQIYKALLHYEANKLLKTVVVAVVNVVTVVTRQLID